MIFNSIEFFIFFIIFFIVYWFIFNKNLRVQNLIILFFSYIFYGWWDYRFLSLLFISSIIDYVVGLKLEKSENKSKRKLLLCISLFANLGMLCSFKYFNFFIDNFVLILDSVGLQPNITSLNIILPVGISFYTFQTMSYTIDIYLKKLKAHLFPG